MDHWPLHARQWALVGPPLRPSDEDVAIVRAEAQRPARTLLLGVTPELAALDLGELVAIDHAQAMIDAIFPAGPGRRAVVGDWTRVPLPDGWADLVLGDGCLSCLTYPHGYHALAAELDRVLAPGGRVIVRLFAAPARRETIDEIAAADCGSFHVFKWRLAMAVGHERGNVRVAEIWRAFEAMVPDRDALPWPRAVIETIDAYRDSSLSYSFPTEDEVVAALAPFTPARRFVPGYELGVRCPTVILVRK
jgi:SAM-dependent methyltransferase